MILAFSDPQPRGQIPGRRPGEWGCNSAPQQLQDPVGGRSKGLLTSHHLRKEPSPTWTQHLHLPPAPGTGQGEGEAECFALGLLRLCSPTGDSQIKDGFWVTYAQISHGEDYILQDKGSIAVLSNGVFCDHGNILYLCSPLIMLPLATWSY